MHARNQIVTGTMTHIGGPGLYGDRQPISEIEQEQRMTDTREAAVITEALSVIDKALAEMLHRELVSTGEVADLLLDVRSLLTSPVPETTQS